MDLLATHLWMTDAIYQAGENIRESMKKALSIEEKSNFRDLVTNVDKETENYFIGKIKEKFPDHRIMGEESSKNSFTDLEGYVWIIDPIDGTMNFIKQNDNFGIMISLFYNGEGLLGYIYDVGQDKMCTAIKGYGVYLNGKRLPMAKEIGIEDTLMNIGDCVMRNDSVQSRALLKKALAFRSIGSAALAEMAVFEGKICAYLNYRLNPWDISPAFLMAKELGYVCVDIYGEEVQLLRKTTCIIGTKKAAQEIIETIKGIDLAL